jgi:hypothetical protein
MMMASRRVIETRRRGFYLVAVITTIFFLWMAFYSHLFLIFTFASFFHAITAATTKTRRILYLILFIVILRDFMFVPKLHWRIFSLILSISWVFSSHFFWVIFNGSDGSLCLLAFWGFVKLIFVQKRTRVYLNNRFNF